MKKIYRLIVLAIFGFTQFAQAQQQSVLNPADPVTIYNKNSPPTQPPYGTIGKWVKTTDLSWNTTMFKPYIYEGMAFRLEYPVSYNPTANDGKTYPMMIFLHGIGELGTIYDNELQLAHCAQAIIKAVDTGSFDGYFLFPQTTSGYWGDFYYTPLNQIITYMVQYNKLDINRVSLSGLSEGSQGDWDYLYMYPQNIADVEANCAASLLYLPRIPVYKYVPEWLTCGGEDTSPDSGTARTFVDSLLDDGGNIKYTLYPTLGHDVWDMHYTDPEVYPYFLQGNKTNPMVLYERSTFCPGDSINITLGLTAGYTSYQWMKNGVIIPGANTNTLNVTSLGSYAASIERGSTWSYWSPNPIVVGYSAVTYTPNITPLGTSDVLPSPDGDSVILTEPSGYASYQWFAGGSNTPIGSHHTIAIQTPGYYQAEVTQLYGCTSSKSDSFLVVNAAGANAPPAPTNLTGYAPIQTSIQLNWVRNPNPAYPETGFEIYRSSTSATGPFNLVGIVPTDTVDYLDKGLAANSQYYYLVRAINNNGASASTPVDSIITLVDNIPPTAPQNLTVGATTRTSVSLSWTAATDNIGVTKYDIYVNGIKSYSTTSNITNFTVYDLTYQQVYTFVVKARDLAGNTSPSSNQVSAAAVLNGLAYSYYEAPWSWSYTPYFDTLSPVKTGVTNNVNLNPADTTVNFGFVWQGYIRIPVSDTYTFATSSDDGSLLYLIGGSAAYLQTDSILVNNDGLHGDQRVSAKQYLQAGVYSIISSYFQAGGGYLDTLLWSSPKMGINTLTPVPDSVFRDDFTMPGTPPSPVSHLTATAVSYKQINLSWSYTSNTQTGFEIYRSNSLTGPFNILTTLTNASATSYVDSSVSANTEYHYKVQAINKYGGSGFGGLNWGYYPGAVSSLPNFSTLTPALTGNINNYTLNVTTATLSYSLLFTGIINIPTTGNYTFYTTSDDGSALYTDSMTTSHEVVNNNYEQSPTQRSGTVTLTAGQHNIYVGYFQAGGGQALSVAWKAPGKTQVSIPDSVLNSQDDSAKTLALPPAPSAPYGMSARTLSYSQIALKFSDTSYTSSELDLYRSVGTNTGFVYYKALPVKSGQTSFTDTSLYSNTTYYYEVLAKGIGGSSAFSNQVSGKTRDNPPFMDLIGNYNMRYGTQLNVNINSSNPQGGTVILSSSNLPGFGTLTDYGNGSGAIMFNPTQASQQGTYKIQVTVTDQVGSSNTQTFTLVVNSDYPPVVTQSPTLTINENSTQTDTIYVTDQNVGDSLTWTINGLPGFATVASTSTSYAVLNLNPGFSDAGTYPLQVVVTDKQRGTGSEYFNIVVNQVNPDRSIYVNFSPSSAYNAGLPWNNTDTIPAQGETFSNLIDNTDTATQVGITITSPWQVLGDGANTLGMNTGNNSGIYPDLVEETAYWTTSTPQTMQVTGLNKAYTYNFTFFGSRADETDNRTTLYTIGSVTDSLNAASNTENTVTISRVQPDNTGSVNISMQASTLSPYGYFNALVIQSNYDNGLPPAAPKNLSGTISAQGGVNLTWNDVAFNALAYQVFRSTSASGPFTLLNPGASNPTQDTYYDSTTQVQVEYYYTVGAVNNHGASANSDTIAVVAPHNAPKLSALSSILVNADTTTLVNVFATGDPADTFHISASGLSAFASLVDSGDGTATLVLAPTSSNIGTYLNDTLKVTDAFGGSSYEVFSIRVKNENYTSTYINFTEEGLTVAFPWNNLVQAISAGSSLNLVDEAGGTGTTLHLLDAWTGFNDLGGSTGNNSGVFPDSVMETAYYTSSNTPIRVQVTGLSQTKLYNFVFFGSRGGETDNRTTYFNIGSQTDSLNGASNTQNTVQINGVIADNTGSVLINVYKSPLATYGYLNAMVIQAYTNSSTPLNPSNLSGRANSRSSITLNWDDNSNNETGFQVWRALAYSGTYTLVNTLAQNTTSYTDTGLTSNTRYFYKVRATGMGHTFSGYSNVGGATTFSYAMYLNFDLDTPAGAPWNNTNVTPEQGDIFSNLLDDDGYNTGTAISITINFAGTNPWGMNTGNNSGVYPDNVISNTYWIDASTQAQLEVSNLNLSMLYNFIFFASRTGNTGDDRLTDYIIGGDTVMLNATNNVNQTVQINAMKPDSNGNVFITMQPGPGSPYGYIGALVMQAYNNYDDNGNPIYTSPRMVSDKMESGIGVNGENGNISASPNPFHDQVTLSLNHLQTDGNTAVALYDMSGKMVFEQYLGGLAPGKNNIPLDFSRVQLASGMYLLRVMTQNGSPQVIRLEKQ